MLNRISSKIAGPFFKVFKWIIVHIFCIKNTNTVFYKAISKIATLTIVWSFIAVLIFNLLSDVFKVIKPKFKEKIKIAILTEEKNKIKDLLNNFETNDFKLKINFFEKKERLIKEIKNYDLIIINSKENTDLIEKTNIFYPISKNEYVNKSLKYKNINELTNTYISMCKAEPRLIIGKANPVSDNKLIILSSHINIYCEKINKIS